MSRATAYRIGRVLIGVVVVVFAFSLIGAFFDDEELRVSGEDVNMTVVALVIGAGLMFYGRRSDGATTPNPGMMKWVLTKGSGSPGETARVLARIYASHKRMEPDADEAEAIFGVLEERIEVTKALGVYGQYEHLNAPRLLVEAKGSLPIIIYCLILFERPDITSIVQQDLRRMRIEGPSADSPFMVLTAAVFKAVYEEAPQALRHGPQEAHRSVQGFRRIAAEMTFKDWKGTPSDFEYERLVQLYPG